MKPQALVEVAILVTLVAEDPAAPATPAGRPRLVVLTDLSSREAGLTEPDDGLSPRQSLGTGSRPARTCLTRSGRVLVSVGRRSEIHPTGSGSRPIHRR